MGPVDNKELRELIYDEVPNLRHCIENRMCKEAVFDIQDWVSATMNFSDGYLLVDHQYASAYEMFNNFVYNHRGAWCGAAACFFARVLELFGIDAFSFNYGLHEQNLSHQTTVVLYYEEGRLCSPIVDSYLGYTYMAARGELLNWPDLLQHIARKEYDRVFLHSRGCYRNVVTMPDQDPSPFSWLFPRGIPDPIDVDGLPLYPMGFMDYPTLFGGEMEDRAREICGATPVEHFYMDLMLHDIYLDPLSLPGPAHKYWKALSQAVIGLAEIAWEEREWQA